MTITHGSTERVLTQREFDADVPVLAGMQRQGDVLILPARVTATTAVPTSGTAVVEGEGAANSHTIYAADGPVYCDTDWPDDENLRIATLTVPQGSTAYLGHPEHGYMGIAPGSYEIRRQREMGRMVFD